MKSNFSHIILNRQPLKYDMRDYRMSDYTTVAMQRRALQITKNEWEVKRILDQGNTPHCVGYAWAGFGIWLPVFDDWDGSMGEKIYYAAKVIDKEPLQENGSSTRSGVKAFSKFANVGKYAFATNIQDIIDWVLINGPVVVGTNWYSGMFGWDSNGLVKISGNVAGGHEYGVTGVDTEKRLFKCTNSWGEQFGINGQFYLGFDHAERLLNEQGDACTAVELVGGAPPVPPGQGEGCDSLIAALKIFAKSERNISHQELYAFIRKHE